MPKIPLVSTIITLILIGPMAGAAADLEAQLDIGGPLKTRLVLEWPGHQYIDELRLIVWMRWLDTLPVINPSYRAAADIAALAVGPLSLTGGMRELGTPHPSSARGSAWRETTGARLDAGFDPVARRGLAFSPGFLPVRGVVIQTDDGLTAVTSVGSWFSSAVRSGRNWVELTAAASWPADETEEGLPTRDATEIGWFERRPMPTVMLHILGRGRLPFTLGTSVVEVGPAVGISLAETLSPGWWSRVAVRAESSSTVQVYPRRGVPVGRDRKAEILAVSSLSSVRYRLPYARTPTDGAVIALAFSADSSEPRGVGAQGVSIPRVSTAGIRASGRITMDWRVAAALPGVPFTLRGLEADRADLDVGIYAIAGRWRSETAASFGVEWDDSNGGAEESSTSTRATSTATDLLVGLEYTGATSQMIRRSGEALIKVARDELRLTGTVDLELGPIDTGSDMKIGLSGKMTFKNEDGPWIAREASVECRTLIHSQTATYRAGIEVKWKNDLVDPITWNARFGWAVARAEG